jgi:iron complex outermembrane receptor protein
MNYRKTLLAASIVTGLCMGSSAIAQDSTTTSTEQATTTTTTTTAAQRRAEEKRATQLGTVIVTGIRNSQAESLALKKDADSHVEIVTSEDIGKLPAKNVADTLQRLPGVNVGTSCAGEGGFY